MLVGVNLDPKRYSTTSKAGTNSEKSKGVVWKIFPLGGPKGTQTYPRAILKHPKEAGLLQGISRGRSPRVNRSIIGTTLG